MPTRSSQRSILHHAPYHAQYARAGSYYSDTMSPASSTSPLTPTSMMTTSQIFLQNIISSFTFGFMHFTVSLNLSDMLPLTHASLLNAFGILSTTHTRSILAYLKSKPYRYSTQDGSELLVALFTILWP